MMFARLRASRLLALELLSATLRLLAKAGMDEQPTREQGMETATREAIVAAESLNGEAVAAPASLSVVIPAFNEEGAVSGVIRHINEILSAAGIVHEIIVVDDGSSDQ